MGVLNFKFYIINSRRLVPIIQRTARTISFTPFLKLAAETFVKCSKFTVDLLGDDDFNREFNKITRDSLAPGSHLDYQNLRANNSFRDLLVETLAPAWKTTTARVSLHGWLRHLITVSASTGVYGSSNPFLEIGRAHV